MIDAEQPSASSLALVREAAERPCQGRLVLVHEGGYSEAYVPFCGLAVMEELSGHRTDVRDPLLDFISQQQPGDYQRKLQTQLIKEMAIHFGLSEQAGSESNLSPLPGL